MNKTEISYGVVLCFMLSILLMMISFVAFIDVSNQNTIIEGDEMIFILFFILFLLLSIIIGAVVFTYDDENDNYNKKDKNIKIIFEDGTYIVENQLVFASYSTDEFLNRFKNKKILKIENI